MQGAAARSKFLGCQGRKVSEEPSPGGSAGSGGRAQGWEGPSCAWGGADTLRYMALGAVPGKGLQGVQVNQERPTWRWEGLG